MRHLARSLGPYLACVACSGSDPGEDSVARDNPADPAALAPPAAGAGFQIDLGRFSLPPGREGSHCIRAPIPPEYAGGPVYVAGADSVLSGSTHHYFASYSEAESVTEQQPCSGDEAFHYVDDSAPPPDAESHVGQGYKMFLGAGEGAYSYRFPDGYAMYLANGRGHLKSGWHVLNLSRDDYELFGKLNVHTRPAAQVTHPIRLLSCLLLDVAVDAHSEATVAGTCTAPFDLDLVMLGSHAHQYLVRFETRLFDGDKTLDEPIYVSTDWDSPKIVALDAPLSLKAGQGLTFSCTYRNGESSPLKFGAGVGQEMCATMNAYAYPPDRPGEVPPSLGALVAMRGGKSPLLDTTKLPVPF
jgi:hypothetical protein